jgi:hypothetical protein
MNGIFLTVIQSAKRDRILLSSFLLTILATVVGIFLGTNALVEQAESKIVYTAGLSRTLLMLSYSVFICLFVRRMFDTKEIYVFLSKPISRVRLLLQLFESFKIILFVMCLPVFLIITIFLGVSFKSAVMWFITLLCEGVVVMSIAVTVSLILNSTLAAISSAILFYFISRAIGEFVAYTDIFVVTNAGFRVIIDTLITTIIKLSSVVLPRLDLFAKSKWLIYNSITFKELFSCIIQSVVFSVMMFFVAVYDFKRKEF